MQFKWLEQAKFAFCVLFLTIEYPGACNAQIVPDATLPTVSTVQLQDNTQLTIEGGTRAGNNLFHSFSEFSVPTNTTAFFNNSADVQNILTRVTGNARSDINGIIKANNSANLFLINPNGIIFGPNARLDIGGSFIGSTANAIGFGSLGNFSATNPEVPSPLLTINPSALLFNQIQRSSIESKSVASDGNNPSNAFEVRGLRVEDGKSLLLVGGNVSVNGGGLYAFGGRVELGGLAGVGSVGLNEDGGNFSLSFPDGIQRSDINLSNNARVNVRVANGGSIGVNANNLEMTENSQLLAGIESKLGSDNSRAGNIDINATGTISLEQNSGIFNDVRQNALGQGGDVNIRANILRLASGSQIGANTSSTGQGGNLNINAASKVELTGLDTVNSYFPSGLFTQQDTEEATGNAGNLTINTLLLQIKDGAIVSTSTFGVGTGGDLKIDADTIEVIGTSSNGFRSQISADTSENATGDAGDLTIKTNTLLVRDGARVSASTFGSGKGGSLTVNAQDVQLIGVSADGQFSIGLFSFSSPNSTGDAGDLTIKTNTLLVRDGAQVFTGTSGSGKGGSLTVDAQDVQLIGTSAYGQSSSGLFSSGEQGSTGDAGDLTVKTNTLLVRDGGMLTAQSESGKGGNIQLEAFNLMLLRRNSLISATSGVPGNNGLDGNINIDTKFLVAVPLENSDIVATGFGRTPGSNIQVNAQGIFGTQFRQQLTPESDIVATGRVTFNVPNVDPSQGLVELPQDVVDVARLVDDNICARTAKSSFIAIGRGGIPDSPDNPAVSNFSWEDWRLLSVSKQQQRSVTVRNTPISNTSSRISNQIVEAQGWVIDRDGSVILTATYPVSLSQNNLSSQCHL